MLIQSQDRNGRDKGIYVSLAIKKNLTDEGEETTTKLEFTEKENIFEVKEKLDKIIEEKMQYNKNREYKHNKKC